MLVNKKCQTCDKEYLVEDFRYSESKYCCRACYDVAQRTTLQIECQNCHKLFNAWPSQVKKGKRFCSKKCYGVSLSKNVFLRCSTCGVELTRNPCDIDRTKTKTNFCSHKCQGIWIAKHSKQKDTNIEIILKNWLLFHNIKFIEQKNIKNISIVDFFIYPDVCLFADGDYWHSKGNRKERDELQTTRLIELGFNVIRLKGSEILAGIRPVQILG